MTVTAARTAAAAAETTAKGTKANTEFKGGGTRREFLLSALGKMASEVPTP